MTKILNNEFALKSGLPADADWPVKKIDLPIKSMDDVRREFREKTDKLRSCTMFDLSECYLSDFVWIVFDRNIGYSRDVQPFEDIQSKEYLHWQKQKRSGKEVMDYRGYACWRYNPIVFYVDEDKPKVSRNRHRLILKDDNETISFLENRNFAIMSPITYVGRNNTSQNARYLYAFAFDLDGVGIRNIDKLMRMMVGGDVPVANIIVNSGHGLHLYYLLKDPVPLYADGVKLLNKMKHGLTNVIWNANTSVDEFRQQQTIFQSFRMPGTLTKFGEPIRAFYNSDAELYTLDTLNAFLSAFKLTEDELKTIVSRPVYNPTGVTLEEAKRQWPEWYASRIVQRKRVGKSWEVKRDVYDWWLNKLRDTDKEITIHHRYWCILTLVVYAVKCNIPREEVLEDGYSLVPKMDSYTDIEDNHFTEADVDDAMRAYDENYNKWPIDTIEKTTNIHIDRNRRNGKSQDIHLRRQRLIQNDEDPDGNWRKGNGRKPATIATSREAKMISEWRKYHHECRNKSQCAREIGLHRNTVAKWWNIVE